MVSGVRLLVESRCKRDVLPAVQFADERVIAIQFQSDLVLVELVRLKHRFEILQLFGAIETLDDFFAVVRPLHVWLAGGAVGLVDFLFLRLQSLKVRSGKFVGIFFVPKIVEQQQLTKSDGFVRSRRTIARLRFTSVTVS